MSKKNFIIATRENFAFQCYRTFISLKNPDCYIYLRSRVKEFALLINIFVALCYHCQLVCIIKLSIVYLYFGGAEIAV